MPGQWEVPGRLEVLGRREAPVRLAVLVWAAVLRRRTMQLAAGCSLRVEPVSLDLCASVC